MSKSNAIKVLEALKGFKKPGAHRVSVIVRKTGMNRKTVARALSDLEANGWVRLSETGRDPKWRLRTWEDVDRDHIRAMARAGGVLY